MCLWARTNSSGPTTDATTRWGAGLCKSLAWACSSHPQTQSEDDDDDNGEEADYDRDEDYDYSANGIFEDKVNFHPVLKEAK